MNQLRTYYKMKMTSGDWQDHLDYIENAVQSVCADASLYGIVPSTGVVTEHSPTPDRTVDLNSTGTDYLVARDIYGNRITIPTLINIDCENEIETDPNGSDIIGDPCTVTTSGNERYLAVLVKYDRQNTVPQVDGNGLTKYKKVLDSYRIKTVVGVEAVSGSAVKPTKPSDDWLYVCDIKLEYDATNPFVDITNAHIDYDRKEEISIYNAAQVTFTDSTGEFDGTTTNVHEALEELVNRLVVVEGSGVVDDVEELQRRNFSSNFNDIQLYFDKDYDRLYTAKADIYNPSNPSVCMNISSGLYGIAFTHENVLTSENSIIFKIHDMDGNAIDSGDVVVATGEVYYPKVVFNGTDFCVFYMTGSTNTNLEMKRYNMSGVLQGTAFTSLVGTRYISDIKEYGYDVLWDSDESQFVFAWGFSGGIWINAMNSGGTLVGEERICQGRSGYTYKAVNLSRSTTLANSTYAVAYYANNSVADNTEICLRSISYDLTTMIPSAGELYDSATMGLDNTHFSDDNYLASLKVNFTSAAGDFFMVAHDGTYIYKFYTDASTMSSLTASSFFAPSSGNDIVRIYELLINSTNNGVVFFNDYSGGTGNQLSYNEFDIDGTFGASDYSVSEINDWDVSRNVSIIYDVIGGYYYHRFGMRYSGGIFNISPMRICRTDEGSPSEDFVVITQGNGGRISIFLKEKPISYILARITNYDGAYISLANDTLLYANITESLFEASSESVTTITLTSSSTSSFTPMYNRPILIYRKDEQLGSSINAGIHCTPVRKGQIFIDNYYNLERDFVTTFDTMSGRSIQEINGNKKFKGRVDFEQGSVLFDNGFTANNTPSFPEGMSVSGSLEVDDVDPDESVMGSLVVNKKYIDKLTFADPSRYRIDGIFEIIETSSGSDAFKIERYGTDDVYLAHPFNTNKLKLNTGADIVTINHSKKYIVFEPSEAWISNDTAQRVTLSCVTEDEIPLINHYFVFAKIKDNGIELFNGDYLPYRVYKDNSNIWHGGSSAKGDSDVDSEFVASNLLMERTVNTIESIFNRGSYNYHASGSPTLGVSCICGYHDYTSEYIYAIPERAGIVYENAFMKVHIGSNSVDLVNCNSVSGGVRIRDNDICYLRLDPDASYNVTTSTDDKLQFVIDDNTKFRECFKCNTFVSNAADTTYVPSFFDVPLAITVEDDYHGSVYFGGVGWVTEVLNNTNSKGMAEVGDYTPSTDTLSTDLYGIMGLGLPYVKQHGSPSIFKLVDFVNIIGSATGVDMSGEMPIVPLTITGLDATKRAAVVNIQIVIETTDQFTGGDRIWIEHSLLNGVGGSTGNIPVYDHVIRQTVVYSSGSPMVFRAATNATIPLAGTGSLTFNVKANKVDGIVWALASGKMQLLGYLD